MNRILLFLCLVFLLFGVAYCDSSGDDPYRLTLESVPEDDDVVEVTFRSIRLSMLYQTAYFVKARQFDEVAADALVMGKNFKEAIKYIEKIERRIGMGKYLYPATFCLGLFLGGYVVAQIQ